MDVVITLPNATIILQQASSAAENTSTRSIYSIIWSCLATLFFCTWVAIHPNSANENETDGVVFVRRLGLMIAMFLVPEMVVCWALRQWVLATYLGKKYKGYPAGVKWRKVHGYFLLMGGFAYYDQDGKLQQLTVSKLENLYDARDIEWPTVSAKQIRDRSKADGLAKSIVLIQTGWFCLQLVARLGKGMVVTELEISTFAFAVLNLIVYILWWNKPFDVRSHVVVRGKTGPEIIYKPLPIQAPSLQPTPDIVDSSSSQDPEKIEEQQSKVVFLPNDLSQRVPESGQRFSKKMKGALLKITPCLSHSDPESQEVLDKVYTKHNWHRYIAGKARHIAKQLWERRPHDFVDYLAFFPSFIFGCFIHPFLNTYVEKGTALDPLTKEDPYHSSVDRQAKSQHPWAGFLFERDAQFAVVSAVGIIFGGLHLIAWPFQFHTDTEKWLWRASSLALIFPPLFFQVHRLLFSRVMKLFKRSSLLETLFILFWYLLLLLAAIAYMTARAILIVLPLMALRHAPEGALADIDWTSHFPHI